MALVVLRHPDTDRRAVVSEHMVENARAVGFVPVDELDGVALSADEERTVREAEPTYITHTDDGSDTADDN